MGVSPVVTNFASLADFTVQLMTLDGG